MMMHLLAGLFDLGKNMGAENDGMVAGQAFDQVAGFVDLFGVEAGGGLVKNQYVGIVNDGLRQADPLPIPFGELAQKLVLHVGHKATVTHIVDALFKLRAGEALELAHEPQIFGRLHLGVERRSFGQIPDSLFDFEGCSRTSKPATEAVPEEGERKQVRMRMVVVFPAPLGPRNPTI